MNIDNFLSYFEKVKSVGQNRWIARCPVHNDKSPSLSIKLVEDRILIHCFAGCTIEEITRAVGFTTKDLFLNSSSPGKKKVDKKIKIEKAIEELHYTLLKQLASILRATDNILFYITPESFDQFPFAELLDKKDYWDYLFFELFRKDYEPELLIQAREEINRWKISMNN